MFPICRVEKLDLYHAYQDYQAYQACLAQVPSGASHVATMESFIKLAAMLQG